LISGGGNADIGNSGDFGNNNFFEIPIAIFINSTAISGVTNAMQNIWPSGATPAQGGSEITIQPLPYKVYYAVGLNIIGPSP
jgi:hypothetical protein